MIFLSIQYLWTDLTYRYLNSFLKIDETLLICITFNTELYFNVEHVWQLYALAFNVSQVFVSSERIDRKVIDTRMTLGTIY